MAAKDPLLAKLPAAATARVEPRALRASVGQGQGGCPCEDEALVTSGWDFDRRKAVVHVPYAGKIEME